MRRRSTSAMREYDMDRRRVEIGGIRGAHGSSRLPWVVALGVADDHGALSRIETIGERDTSDSLRVEKIRIF